MIPNIFSILTIILILTINKVTGASPTHYLQRDPKWAQNRMMPNSECKSTIGRVGCLITSLSMVINDVSEPLDPAQFVKRQNKFDGFFGCGALAAQPMRKAFKGIRRIVLIRDPKISQVMVDDVVGLFWRGKRAGHWVRVIEVREDKIITLDPAFKEPRTYRQKDLTNIWRLEFSKTKNRITNKIGGKGEEDQQSSDLSKLDNIKESCSDGFCFGEDLVCEGYSTMGGCSKGEICCHLGSELSCKDGECKFKLLTKEKQGEDEVENDNQNENNESTKGDILSNLKRGKSVLKRW
jgi:hypothetical protein